MSALDEPNLRGRAIRDGADFLTRLLFGGARTSRSLDKWWSVPFGLVSLAAPVVLVVFVVARAVRALAGGGPIIGLLVVALEATVVLVGVVLLVKALRRALRSGISRPRFVSVSAALIAGIVIAGALIPVPLTATFGFFSHHGGVILVHGGEAAKEGVPAGARVVLMSSGIVGNERVGEGTVRPRRPEQTEVPLDALFPVKADGVSVSAVIIADVDVTEEFGNLPSTGQARVELGTRNLWQTLWATGVTAPLSSLQNDK